MGYNLRHTRPCLWQYRHVSCTDTEGSNIGPDRTEGNDSIGFDRISSNIVEVTIWNTFHLGCWCSMCMNRKPYWLCWLWYLASSSCPSVEKSIMTRGQNFDFTRGHQWRFFYIISNKFESDEKCVLPELFGDFWEKNEKSLKVLWMAAAQPPLLCPGSQLGNFDQPVATMFTMQRWKVKKKGKHIRFAFLFRFFKVVSLQ